MILSEQLRSTVHVILPNTLFYKYKEPKLKYLIDERIFVIESLHTILIFCSFHFPTAYYSVEDMCKVDLPTHPTEHPLRYILNCQLDHDPMITGWIYLSKSLLAFMENTDNQLYVFNDALTYERVGTSMDPCTMLVNNRYLSYFCELGVILIQLHHMNKGQQVYSNIPNMSKKYQWPRLIEYYSLENICVLF